MSSIHRDRTVEKRFDPFVIADMLATERMEKKKAMEVATRNTASIGGLQTLFRDFAQDELPEMPHLLEIIDADKGRWNSRSHEELIGIPWNLPHEHSEARRLQYMTVFSTGDRDLQVPRAFDHEDPVESPTNSGGRSSLNTPQRDPNKKFSLAAYQKMKKDGIKPTPRTSDTPDPVRPKGHARTTSNISNATPTARGSFESSSNGEIQRNGSAVHSANRSEHVVKNGIDRNPPSRSNPNKPHHLTNGTNGVKTRTEQTKDFSRSKEFNAPQNKSSTKMSPSIPTWNAPMKHSLPPRPQSPRRVVSDGRNNKRSLESDEPSHAEKRARTDRANSHLQKIVKPDNNSSKGKAPPSNLSNPKKSDQKVSTSNTPSKPKPVSGKKPPPKELSLQQESPTTPPRTVSPFVLPPLLSPTLPPIVEAELAEHKQKEGEKTTSAPEHQRHTQARKPDAPGVARKTVTGAKFGHPPKRSASNTPLQKPREVSKAPATNQSLIVRLPYSRRKATTIERLVRLSPRPSQDFTKLENIRKKEGFEAMMAYDLKKEKAPVLSANIVMDQSVSESEEDIPLSSQSRKTTSRKRPSDVLPSKPEPPTKRAKRPDNLDVTTARKTVPSQLKSPTRPGPSQKGLLATPKKNEGSRGTAMVRVSSSDGNPQTPQGANITVTTPQSISTSRSDQLKTLAYSLKKKGEHETRINGNQHQLKPVAERTAGVIVVIESICQYMRYFKGLPCASPRETSYSQRSQNAQNWDTIIPMLAWLKNISEDIPVLQVLSAHLNAVCLEVSTRAFISMPTSPGNTEDDRAKDRGIWSKQQSQDLKRHDAWRQSHHVGYKLLKDLSSRGEPTIIGPWTSVETITAYCMEVCTAFNKKDKWGWKKQVDF
ncbi:hypothetical protein BOTCAL_0403g00010 [Botryotinia calthae]|uniref:Uncharacterized protein n=1 Tax=Botryotinia calthae TaxID=38488 RepID=A0A4Y8CQ80_9HELO|nr:hypothetical protein BOTCAL_0403g00010 [Botryotinia calthae]